MISYSATWDPVPALGERVQTGSSEEASFLDCEMDRLLKHYAAPRMGILIAEIDELVADSLAAELTHIDEGTARAAIEFAFLLPRSLPAPEVASDSDGEIEFDWLGPKQKIFSVVINKTGRIAFAGRFSERSKIHGTEQLSSFLPADILRGIAKATS